jgi:DNA gyrase inhibitor GyrI
MNVEVKEMPEFQVAYVRNIGAYGPEGCGRAFEKLMQWACPRGFAATGTMLGVSWDNPEITPPEKCRYDACVTVPPGTATEGEVNQQTIPGETFAVYHCRIRVDEFPRVCMELMGEWLPGAATSPTTNHAMNCISTTGWRTRNSSGLWTSAVR